MRFDKQFWAQALLWSAIFLVVSRLLAEVEASPIPGEVIGVALAIGIVAVATSAVGLLVSWKPRT